MSLPVKLRALAVGKIDERPVFRARHKLFPHGIFQDVTGLLPPAFIVPQAVLKKIPLPADAGFFRRPFFPLADDGWQRLAGGKETSAYR